MHASRVCGLAAARARSRSGGTHKPLLKGSKRLCPASCYYPHLVDLAVWGPRVGPGRPWPWRGPPTYHETSWRIDCTAASSPPATRRAPTARPTSACQSATGSVWTPRRMPSLRPSRPSTGAASSTAARRPHELHPPERPARRAARAADVLHRRADAMVRLIPRNPSPPVPTRPHPDHPFPHDTQCSGGLPRARCPRACVGL